jgi:putative acetyltransferase
MIRLASGRDIAAIRKVLTAAFPGPEEAKLVEDQRMGIGSALARKGLSKLTEAGEDVVVVLGEPAFYERLGFSRAAAARLRTPYDGPHLLAKVLSEWGSRAHGEVRYAPAFAALG